MQDQETAQSSLNNTNDATIDVAENTAAGAPDGKKEFPKWETYEKYMQGVTMDTGERPLIDIDPYYRDPKTHVKYHDWLN